MVIGKFIFVLLLGAIAILTIRSAFCSTASTLHKIAYCCIRLFMTMLLGIAFFEPTITVHRIVKKEPSIPVLVDASKSMGIFAVDAVLASLQQYEAKIVGDGTRPIFTYYFFGDSLRRRNTPASYRAHDIKSEIPLISDYRKLRDAGEYIVVSDGFWTGGAAATSIFNEKPVWYVPLSPYGRHPFLSITAPDTVRQKESEPCKVVVDVQGAVTKPCSLAVRVFHEERRIADSVIQIDRGVFSHIVPFHLPARSAGVHLYRIEAVVRDSVTRSTQQYLLRHVVPGVFYYTMHADTPSLDLRFITNALLRDKRFKRVAAASAHRDVNFVVDNRSNAATVMDSVFTVFLGCAPGGYVASPWPVNAEICAGELYDVVNQYSGMNLTELPPLSVLLKPAEITVVAPLLATCSNSGAVPLLYFGTFQKHPVVIGAMRGFWQWDFLPLAHDNGETEIFPFSRRLLGHTASYLYNQILDTLLVFPAKRLEEGHPVALNMVLPVVRDTASALQVSVKVTSGSGAKVFDTLCVLHRLSSLLHSVSIPSLPSGTFTVITSCKQEDRSYRHEITIEVTPDEREHLVSMQNELFFREIGQPLDYRNEEQLSSLVRFHQENSAVEQPVAERIPLRRSGWLLAAILLLFCGELLLRRIDGLD